MATLAAVHDLVGPQARGPKLRHDVPDLHLRHPGCSLDKLWRNAWRTVIHNAGSQKYLHLGHGRGHFSADVSVGWHDQVRGGRHGR